MWLMTKHGFYSIVEKKPGEFHVRSRERRDLENLVERVPLSEEEILDTPSHDYAVRLIVDASMVRQILAFLAATLDYDNFKGRIDQTSDQKHKPYHEIWDIMYEALGGYGRPGK
ncbi:MAG: hypothetical protein QGF00_07015 [Planctomycetota bacterium]|nr:hypothetical protein [Planctomycetota bacterium]